LSHVRSTLIDELTRVFLFAAVLALGIGILRDGIEEGSARHLWFSAVVVLTVLVLHRVRARLPVPVRSSIVVGALLLAGLNAIRVYGVSAPAAFLVPAGLLLCWFLLGARAAALALVIATAAFAILARAAMTHGPASPLLRFDRSDSALVWLNLLSMQILVGGILILTIRGLVRHLVRERMIASVSADRLEGILDGIRDATLVYDPATSIIERANPAAGRLFGQAHADLVGQNLLRLLDRGGEAAGDRTFGLPGSDSPSPFLWKCRTGDGRTFWAEVLLRPLTGAHAGRILATFRDVDAAVAEEALLHELTQNLESQVALRTRDLEAARRELEFIAQTVSADLRRPLVRIREHSAVLRSDLAPRLDEDGVLFLARIQAGSERMEALIEALLGLSSIDAHPPQLESVDMAALARECCQELVDADSRESPSKCRVSWTIEEVPTCRTDAALIRQVWSNLLSNAFKFTADTPEARVIVRHLERPDGIWFEVADNGPGFDMAQAHKLFRIFQRLREDGPEGLGIGLATCQRILDRLGGSIEAEGHPGKGATFRFRPGPASPQSSEEAR